MSVRENGKEIIRSKLTIRRNGECKLFMGEPLLPDSVVDRGQVYCSNDRYYFSLTRRELGKGWAFEHSSERDGEVSQSLTTRFLDPAVTSFYTPICIWTGVDIISLVSQPDFQAKSARWVDHHGETLVELVFDISRQATAGAKGHLPVRGGKFILDPSRYWCVRSAEVEWGNARSTTHNKNIVLKHKGERGEFPIPWHYLARYELTVDNEVKLYVVEKSFDLTIPEQLPSFDSFTLAAFGLPEPWELQQKATPPTRWFLWLTLVGVALLVLGAFFYYRVRRRTA